MFGFFEVEFFFLASDTCLKTVLLMLSRDWSIRFSSESEFAQLELFHALAGWYWPLRSGALALCLPRRRRVRLKKEMYGICYTDRALSIRNYQYLI